MTEAMKNIDEIIKNSIQNVKTQEENVLRNQKTKKLKKTKKKKRKRIYESSRWLMK